jgi:lipoprotein-releasing system permease protein
LYLKPSYYIYCRLFIEENRVRPEFYLSLRYFFSQKRRSSISLVSTISVFCVALAVMVLIVVFSVLNGFHEDMKIKILSKESHITLTSPLMGSLWDYASLIERIEDIPGVALALPYYEGQGLISWHSAVRGVKIRGVVPDLLERDPDFMTSFALTEGSFDLSSRNGIVVGEVLAHFLGIRVGDRVSLFVPPEQGGDAFMLPLNIEYRVAGIFSSGFSEYDEFFVFMSLKDAQILFGTGDIASAVGIKLDDYNQATEYRDRINQATEYSYNTLTWMQQRRNLYQALVTEKTLIGVVLFFVIAMAAFSIASTLIMVVMEKEREIGILKSIGMTPDLVMKTFLVQGSMVGLLGTVIGMFAGLLIAASMNWILRALETVVNVFNQSFYDIFNGLVALPYPRPWKLFPEDVYYVSTFPIRIDAFEVFAICLGSMLLTALCSLIPARQAARLKVTEVLHKE